MQNETLQLAIDTKGIKAYYNDPQACAEQKQILELLFGKQQLAPEKPKDVTERVKTFQDACNELGNNHPLVHEWDKLYDEFGGTLSPDLAAYLKLRIITAALNEGWEPQFTNDEYHYYPWFCLYTKKEYEQLSYEDKQRCVVRSNSNANADGGLVFAYTGSGSACSYTSVGVRLAFRTRELALYAGKQFADIWADFLLKSETAEDGAITLP